ncbi:MAG: IDEAL domain-containing protein [Bacillota bacterium]|nr:IDEAL domain-containing protein [Bacillota bacterium]
MIEGQWVTERKTGNLGYITQCSYHYHYVKFIRTAKGRKMNVTTWVVPHELEPVPIETWTDKTQIDLALDTKDSDYFYHLTGVRDESK